MNFKLITPERFPNEKNDCVVIAVAEVEGIPYPQAYDRVFLGGRDFRRGAHTKEYVKGKAYTNCMPKSLGPSNNSMWPKFWKPTLIEVVRTHRHGKYIVCNRSHAMALIDGVIYDLAEPKWRSEIQEIWKFE